MVISMDKKYTTYDGRPVRIYAVDAGGDCPIHGAIYDGKLWNVSSWTQDGYYSKVVEYSSLNLIEAWEPQDKEPIWCWDNDDSIRVLRFWDAKNKRPFSYARIRNGPKWDNYAKVEHIEQWMLDMQAKLED